MLKGIMGVAVAVLFSVSAASAAVIEQGGENMSRTEICKQNYRRLFNGEALTDVGNAPEQKGLAVFQLLRDFPRREAGTAFRTAVRFSAEGSTAHAFSCSPLTRGRSRQS